MPVAGAAAGARPAYSSSRLPTSVAAMADLVPGALVLRLFLAPHDFARIRILGEHGFHFRRGNG